MSDTNTEPKMLTREQLAQSHSRVRGAMNFDSMTGMLAEYDRLHISHVATSECLDETMEVLDIRNRQIAQLRCELEEVREAWLDIARRMVAHSNERVNLVALEDVAVAMLCEQVGYGAVMDSASRQWRRKLRGMGIEGGAFVVGPCIGTLDALIADKERLNDPTA